MKAGRNNAPSQGCWWARGSPLHVHKGNSLLSQRIISRGRAMLVHPMTPCILKTPTKRLTKGGVHEARPALPTPTLGLLLGQPLKKPGIYAIEALRCYGEGVPQHLIQEDWRVSTDQTSKLGTILNYPFLLWPPLISPVPADHGHPRAGHITDSLQPQLHTPSLSPRVLTRRPSPNPE